MSFDLRLGDALEVMRTLPSGSVDAVVMDPPYFLPAQHYASRAHGWLRSLSDLSILEHFFRDVFAECRRVLKPDGHCLAFCDAQSYPVFYAVAYQFFPMLDAVVWDKGRIGMGNPWRKQHELILACWSSGAKLNGTASTVIASTVVPTGERIHPAEKPVALIRHLVELITQPGELVLDPFMGSGTTGVAAVATGRRFLGIERDGEYHKLATARLEGALPEPDLFSVLEVA